MERGVWGVDVLSLLIVPIWYDDVDVCSLTPLNWNTVELGTGRASA